MHTYTHVYISIYYIHICVCIQTVSSFLIVLVSNCPGGGFGGPGGGFGGSGGGFRTGRSGGKPPLLPVLKKHRQDHQNYHQDHKTTTGTI